MNDPQISIIVPVYNVEEKLSKCLNSLIHQSFSSIEIILVNDGSTDHSLAICQSYQTTDSRIKVISQKNQGLSAARNAGLKKAIGSYIMFVDSDDYVTNTFCEDAFNNVVKFHADLGFFNHRRIENGQSTDVIQFGATECNLAKDAVFENILLDSYAWNKIYKKELFNEVKYPIGINYEDLYTTYKLVANANKVSYCPAVNYNYVSSGTSIVSDMSAQNIANQFGGVLTVMDFLKTNYPHAYQDNKYRLIKYAIRYCTYCDQQTNENYYSRAYHLLKSEPVPAKLDLSHRLIMRLFKFSAPITRYLLLIRRHTNQ